eukprot:c7437_g1_i1.p1 GENE.c7437_g1_i1~~c7437_g1_i1.p1  ORF type:complete len:140 (+),score=32.29 c7437_g1_i1:106-525(+)
MCTNIYSDPECRDHVENHTYKFYYDPHHFQHVYTSNKLRTINYALYIIPGFVFICPLLMTLVVCNDCCESYKSSKFKYKFNSTLAVTATQANGQNQVEANPPSCSAIELTPAAARSKVTVIGKVDPRQESESSIGFDLT